MCVVDFYVLCAVDFYVLCVVDFYVLCVVDLLRAVKDILGTYKGQIRTY